MQETRVRFLGHIGWRRDRRPTPVFLGFPVGSASKESACNVGDLDSIPGLGRSPGEGKGYPFQYSGLENSMDCIVHGGHKELDTTEWLSLIFVKHSPGALVILLIVFLKSIGFVDSLILFHVSALYFSSLLQMTDMLFFQLLEIKFYVNFNLLNMYVYKYTYPYKYWFYYALIGNCMLEYVESSLWFSSN